MLEEDVAGESVSHLIGKNLLVHRPGQWLAPLVLQVSDSCDGRVLCIVGVDDADEVIFGECLKVEEQVFDHLVVGLLVGGLGGEETRQTVDHDQLEINLQLLALQLSQDHRKEHKELLEVAHLDYAQS